MPDYLFRGKLAELDPEVQELTQLESERQARKLILIASETSSPLAVREALASSFQNLYAEGYPDEDTRWMTEAGNPGLSCAAGALPPHRRPALLQGRGIRRCGRGAGPPARRRGLRRQRLHRRPDLCERAGPFRRARQQCRLPGADQPRRDGHGPQPAARRPSLARLLRQPLRQVVQCGALHRGREGTPGLRPDPRHGARDTNPN